MRESFAEFLLVALSNTTGRLEISVSPKFAELDMRYYDGGKVAGFIIDAYVLKQAPNPDRVIAEAICGMRQKVEQEMKGGRP